MFTTLTLAPALASTSAFAAGPAATQRYQQTPRHRSSQFPFEYQQARSTIALFDRFAATAI